MLKKSTLNFVILSHLKENALRRQFSEDPFDIPNPSMEKLLQHIEFRFWGFVPSRRNSSAGFLSPHGEEKKATRTPKEL